MELQIWSAVNPFNDVENLSLKSTLSGITNKESGKQLKAKRFTYQADFWSCLKIFYSQRYPTEQNHLFFDWLAKKNRHGNCMYT